MATRGLGHPMKAKYISSVITPIYKVRGCNDNEKYVRKTFLKKILTGNNFFPVIRTERSANIFSKYQKCAEEFQSQKNPYCLYSSMSYKYSTNTLVVYLYILSADTGSQMTQNR